MTHDTHDPSDFQESFEASLESRADLVELLLNSILEEDNSGPKKVDAAWAKEAKDRFDAFLRGEIQANPMHEMIDTLSSRQRR